VPTTIAGASPNAGVARGLGAGGLLVVAAVHANWARRSWWPAPDEKSIAQVVLGANHMPSSSACLAVASLLTASSALVLGRPRRLPRVRRLGAGIVVAVLGARGLIGSAGLMPQERRSVTFKHWNRRLYSPLCLSLAALCAPAALPRRGRR
jgi:Protein of unknown function (DUF3995)